MNDRNPRTTRELPRLPPRPIPRHQPAPINHPIKQKQLFGNIVTAVYKRYLEKFDKQETEIEQLQARIKEAQQAEHQQRKEYEAYLTGLTVE